MISVDIMGGLGNQLFQIMTAFAYSKKYRNHLIIKRESHSPSCTYRNVYWNNFLEGLQKYLINGNIDLPVYNEKSFEYNELPKISESDDIKLSGYFQSYKYFDEYKSELLAEIDWYAKRDAVKSKITDVNPGYMVSLHFRIGDFKNLENHPIMPMEYYINAIKYIEARESNVKILYFCEEDDKDFVFNNYINPLRTIFENITFTQTKNKLEDWEQMIAMSLCKHHIIANSTFSWWSAYLADDNDKYKKLICYPDIWFNSTLINNMMDLFPGHWIMCETLQNKYLLENVYYINLEERVDRKVLVETELKKMKWKYERFNAIKHERGILGCCLSHLAVIEMAKEKDLDYVVILEDDIQFLQPEKYNKMLIDFRNFVESNSLDYDVLLIATNILDKVSGVIPINNYIYRVGASYSAAGYIVKKHYYDKIIANYKEGLRLLIENTTVSGKYEFDVYWIKLQMVDKWLVLYPRTVNQRESYSDILNCMTDYTKHMIDI
jgi:hypothetical protein